MLTVGDGVYSFERTTKDGRSILIREAERRDAEAVLGYITLISQETDFLTFGPGEFRLTLEEESDYLEKCRCAENCLYLLAVLEEIIVGTLTFQAGTRPRVRHAGELGLSVLRAYWGIGIGSSLMDSLLEWSRSGNVITKIDLRVRADNERAIALYRRKGFVVEGTLKNEINLKGVYHDNLWMGLILEGYGDQPDK
jgi:RimJ/RimL family protein N-acetyltransferase